MATLFDGYGRFELSDVTEYDYEPFDVATLFLVVMFLPIGKRKAFLRLLYERLNVGGALIVVDKTEDASRYIGTIYRRLTLAGKVASGVDANEILQKELSLSGIQRPISRDIFPFVYYEFFRFGEFSGFIIEK
jgi:tRNA (cmo5U34)-methyltransferase